MQLTGKQIVERGILQNVCVNGIQQQGIDVRVIDIKRVDACDNLCGFIPATGKTLTPVVTPINLQQNYNSTFWELAPGYYEVTFEEGCQIPADCAMYFKTRSSLVRCGAEIRSGQFDGGFETDHMGAFLKVELPIKIEKGARVAQAIINETYPVEKEYLYDGQWQRDNQRQ